MKHRWLAALFAVVLLMMAAVPVYATTLSKAELYDAAKTELEKYLNDEATMPLDDLFMRFSELGSYEMSIEFALYTDVLRSIENEDFGRIFVFTSILRQNASFGDYLDEVKVYGTLDELECYARGRQAEQSGDMKSAYEYYNGCLTFMDSSLRVRKQLVADLDAKYQEALQAYALNTMEGYTKAYDLFYELAAYNYENSAALMSTSKALMDALAVQLPFTATPVPASASAPTPAATTRERFQVTSTATKSGIRLTWDKANNNAVYTIYRRTKNGSWKQLNQTKETSYYDSSVGAYTNYIYYIEATWDDSTATSVETYIQSMGKDSSSSATAKATATPKPQVWGSWSSWSTTPVNASSTRQVETKTETENTYATKYCYRKWHYWTTKGSWYNAPVEYYNSPIFSNEKEPYWQYKTTDEPLAKAGTTSANGQSYTYYTGYWFYIGEEQVVTGSKTVTYYRYRNLQ